MNGMVKLKKCEAKEKVLPPESTEQLGKETLDLVIHLPQNTRKSGLKRKHTHTDDKNELVIRNYEKEGD